MSSSRSSRSSHAIGPICGNISARTLSGAMSLGMKLKNGLLFLRRSICRAIGPVAGAGGCAGAGCSAGAAVIGGMRASGTSEPLGITRIS
jgi:hypothetical protein